MTATVRTHAGCAGPRALTPVPSLPLSAPRPCAQDAKRMMPNLDVAQTLRTNPDMILMLVKGKSLIPYDPAPPRW